ncbi:MAG: glucose 1-dehydrogenase [Candidatus Nanopelagicales bacterium]|nr:glucose 1-dehydrogenase [Candidatus Nanopelagicales bacterium]
MGIHSNKGIVVTGGSSGIGLGIVERFLSDGATVVVADIKEPDMTTLAAKYPNNIFFSKVDVCDESLIRSSVELLLKHSERLDVMVNNAGIINVAGLADTTAESWLKMLNVNVVGVALGSKVAAEYMSADKKGGVIVNASSGGGRHGVPMFSQYCASKAAIIMMSQSFAQELAPAKIRVNCYTPGHIMTPLWEDIVEGMGKKLGKSREDTLADFLSTVPWGRFGTPADVAATVSWLCTDDAEYVSGQCIGMNGAELPW